MSFGNEEELEEYFTDSEILPTQTTPNEPSKSLKESMVNDQPLSENLNESTKHMEINYEKVNEFGESTSSNGVYLSRIPPYMNPSMIKKTFAKYGVERIYLTPEIDDMKKNHTSRVRSKRKCYTQGWIEFSDKETAKTVAICFNNVKIGYKKKSFYSEDVWNIRYLPKFQWENLLEKIDTDENEHCNPKLSVTKKERNYYAEDIGKPKKIVGVKKLKNGKRRAKIDICRDIIENKENDKTHPSSKKDDTNRPRRSMRSISSKD